MANPLDEFVLASPNKFQVRVLAFPQMPDISRSSPAEINQTHQVHAQAVEKWRQDLERTLQNVAANAEAASTAAATTAATTVTAAVDQATKTIIESTQPEPLPIDLVTLADEQSLERKTIGLSLPRLGRFTHVISSNVVLAGESVYVPADCNLVVAGPFKVFGSISFDGSFASV